VASYPGIQRPAREASHLEQSIFKLKNMRSFASISSACFHVVCSCELADGSEVLGYQSGDAEGFTVWKKAQY
jgi:hypothetical protein